LNKGLAGTLRVPDKASIFGGIGATLHHRIYGATLVLTQHRLSGFAVFDVEQKPLTRNITSARLPLRAGGFSAHSQET
jgi:hypothetical protein